MEFVNRICPKCKDPNYVVYIADYNKKYKYKCMNCNGYFSEEDLKTPKVKESIIDWEHLWDAPDGSFKGRCNKCGFVHYFIEGHDAQYKFCPQCGEQKVIAVKCE